MPTLVIANKCYSSWSMRPWLVMRQFGLPFEEVLIPFQDPIGNEEWKRELSRYTPAGKVPALVDGDIRVWDSLAIMEYLADTHPDLAIWPRDRVARAMARSASAEMHSGFQALRGACPMNLGKRFPARDRGEEAAKDVARIVALWSEARERFGQGGPFLFGTFTAADAMYAPVCCRFRTYSIDVPPLARDYMEAVFDTAAFKQWLEGALAEPWIVPEDEADEEPAEVYRKAA